MSRTFNNSTANRLTGTAPVTSVPLTMACWFRSASTSQFHTLMTIGDTDTSNTNYLRLLVLTGGGALQFAVKNSGSTRAAATTASVSSTGVWYHCLCIMDSLEDIYVYLNGANEASDVFTSLPAGLDGMSVGVEGTSTVQLPARGDIAWPCVWSAELSAADRAALAARAHPLSVKPESIAAFWPMHGDSAGAEVDRVGGFDLAESGTVTGSDSPMLTFGWPLNATRDAGAEPGGFSAFLAARATSVIQPGGFA